METFLNFLVQNWQYISIGLVVLLEVILLIIKRKPKKYDQFVEAVGDAIVHIPEFIQKAEDLDEDGLDRKVHVVSWLLDIVEGRLKRDLSYTEEKYCFDSFSHYIEEVLNCPTKKGGCGREDE